MMEKNVSFETMYAVMEEAFSRGETVVFSPSGVSMNPTLRSGRDRVVLAPLSSPPKCGEVVLYRRPNGQFVLHRVIGRRNGAWRMRGDNQYRTEYPVESSWLLAKMIGYYRGERYISAGVGHRIVHRLTALPLYLLRRAGVRLWRALHLG